MLKLDCKIHNGAAIRIMKLSPKRTDNGASGGNI